MSRLKGSKYVKEEIAEAVRGSRSWREVCKWLGVKPHNNTQVYLKKKAVNFGIDYSHFPGVAFRWVPIQKKKDAMEYCKPNTHVSSSALRIRLITQGYKEEKCEFCGITSWHGEQVPLELDHKDSNHFNNSFNNLQILCANCHSVETKKRLLQQRILKGGRESKKRSREERSSACSAAQKKRFHTPEFLDRILTMRSSIEKSHIDFKTFGWVGEAAKLLQVSHTQVRRFMKKHMPEFYSGCYQRIK